MKAILLTLCLTSSLLAEAPSKKSGDAIDLKKNASQKLATDAPVAPVRSEVFTDIVIAPGKSFPIDSTMDYSSSNGLVAITILCSVCTTAATSLGNSGLILQALWSVPDAGSYAAVEIKPASSFPYWDAGGALFDVHGSQFRLTLQNRGTQAVTIQQVTIFRPGQ